MDNDFSERVYDNTRWTKKRADRDEQKKTIYVYAVILGLFFLSLLANAGLAYLCFMEGTNKTLQCDAITNCTSTSTAYTASDTICSYRKNWTTFNDCPDLPEQWVKNNGSIYVFSSHNKSWTSSRQHCRGLGGDLVKIKNPEEKDFIAQRLCMTAQFDHYWTGTEEKNYSSGSCAGIQGRTQQEFPCLTRQKSICEIFCNS